MKNPQAEKKDPKRYQDMLHLPHHQSASRPHMSPSERAAQFSPFAALTGYEDEIQETARLTFREIELDENSKALLDEKLRLLQEHLEEHPEISVTYFVPDERKDGGAYVTLTGNLKKIDRYERTLLLSRSRIVRDDPMLPASPSSGGSGLKGRLSPRTDSAPRRPFSYSASGLEEHYGSEVSSKTASGRTEETAPNRTGEAAPDRTGKAAPGRTEEAAPGRTGKATPMGTENGNGETAVPIDRIIRISEHLHRNF